MKKQLGIVLALLFSSFIVNAQTSFYDLTCKTIDGADFNFSTLKGKKVLIVNTASKCGYTGQYADLEKLYDQFKNQNFIIIGFPSNDFMWQEPGSNADIKEFCTKNYGVSFLMMEKISVKGSDMHPVYKWLTQKVKNGKMDSSVKWNFQKYLIAENGQLIEMFATSVNPLDETIVSKIKK